MTKVEFNKIALAIKAYYPRVKMLDNDYAIELWYNALGDLDYMTTAAALEHWRTNEKWPPTIADLREGCLIITEGETQPWGEAWEEVVYAIWRYGYMRQTEALNSMSEVTRKAVRNLGWMNLCTSENVMSDRANFRDIYNELAERDRKQKRMSPRLRKLIEANVCKRLPS